MKPRSSRLLNLAASFSLSGLLLARVWSKLQSPWGWADIATKSDYAAAITNIALGTGIMLGLVTLAARSKNRIAMEGSKLGFLIVTVAGLWSLSSAIWPEFLISDPMHSNIGFVAMAIAAAVLVIVIILFALRREATVRVVRVILILLLPVSLTSVLQSAYHMAFNSSVGQGCVRNLARGRDAHRVVVLLFDEMDELTAFAERPSDLCMPEFDRFRREAVVGENSYPPGYRTILSIPSFLTGKLTTNAEMLQSGGLMVTEYGTSHKARFSLRPTLFSETRSMGVRSALVSDGLPYGHMMGSLPDFIYSRVYDSSVSPSFGISMLRQWQNLPAVDRIGLVPLLETNQERHGYVQAFRRILKESETVVSDPRYDFTFVHLCMPHVPFIYDRHKGDFSDDADRTYADNLALSDRAFGDLRRTMEAANQWDSSTVIVLSDHWWRARPCDRSDHRSVFMVKLPYEKSGVLYRKAFNTIIFHNLVLASLGGKIGSPSEMSAWLDRHSPFGEDAITKSYH
jgi:hypothetical protein